MDRQLNTGVLTLTVKHKTLDIFVACSLADSQEGTAAYTVNQKKGALNLFFITKKKQELSSLSVEKAAS